MKKRYPSWELSSRSVQRHEQRRHVPFTFYLQNERDHRIWRRNLSGSENWNFPVALTLSTTGKSKLVDTAGRVDKLHEPLRKEPQINRDSNIYRKDKKRCGDNSFHTVFFCTKRRHTAEWSRIFRHFLPLRNRLQKTVIPFCAKWKINHSRTKNQSQPNNFPFGADFS